MDAERWRKIEEVYHAALRREGSQRAAFVEQACSGDGTLQRDLESLLAQAGETGSFMETPAAEVAAQALACRQRSFPASIGRYRIVRLLGEGGMGAVYEAEQEQPRRRVALKVIRPGLATEERLWRFEHESHALGRLQHPGISQIYEASTADTGFGPQPYFAMELIRGHTLERYAEEHALDTRRRLALMVKVCDAVQHAHQRGLIHRDLKPGNILVDETGQPKVLDFGVARVTGSEARETHQTSLGQLVGTLAYMSPEQALGDPLDVDARSDVYSLGVILYELLSGQRPYTVERSRLHHAMQTIRDQEPPPLGSISRDCRGDVETIVRKTLEKDKARRYPSAADLSADIERYLRDEPILARAPSAGYHLRKFARRRRALVAGAMAVFGALLAGFVVSTYESVRAHRAGQAALAARDRAETAQRAATQERDRALQAERTATSERNRAVAAEAKAVQERNRADLESSTAKAVNSFLQDDLLAQAGAGAQASPDMKPDPDLKVRTALDRAAAAVAGKFDGQPLVEASIRQTIGKAYFELGIYPAAQMQMERALDLRRRLLGEDHRDTQASTIDLATLYRAQGAGQKADALRLKVLEIRRRLLGENHPDTLRTMSELAVVDLNEGELAEAATRQTKLLEIQRRVLGENHPDTLVSINNLAWQYRIAGKYADAEPLARQVLDARQRALGSEHPDTLRSMNDMAGLYRMQGKYAQAEALYLRLLEIERRVLGENHPSTLRTMNNLAITYAVQDKDAQSDLLLTNVLEVQRRVLGPLHSESLDSLVSLGLICLKQRNFLRAETLSREYLALVKQKGPDNWRRYLAEAMVGASLAGQGRYRQAEPFLVSGHEGMAQRRTTIPPAHRGRITWAGESVVQLYESLGNTEKAAEWRVRLNRN